MGNVVLTTPRHWNEYGLRPFVSGGFGFFNASRQDVVNFVPRSMNLFGWNVGGGATGFFTDFTGVRFDLRFFKTLQSATKPVVSAAPPAILDWRDRPVLRNSDRSLRHLSFPPARRTR